MDKQRYSGKLMQSVTEAIIASCMIEPGIPLRASRLMKVSLKRGSSSSTELSGTRNSLKAYMNLKFLSRSLLEDRAQSRSTYASMHRVWRACVFPINLRFLHLASQEVMFLQILSSCLKVRLPHSVAVVAEILLRSPRKLFIFIIKNLYLYDQSIRK